MWKLQWFDALGHLGPVIGREVSWKRTSWEKTGLAETGDLELLEARRSGIGGEKTTLRSRFLKHLSMILCRPWTIWSNFKSKSWTVYLKLFAFPWEPNTWKYEQQFAVEAPKIQTTQCIIKTYQNIWKHQARSSDSCHSISISMGFAGQDPCPDQRWPNTSGLWRA